MEVELPPARLQLPTGADPHSPEFLAALSGASLSMLGALGGVAEEAASRPRRRRAPDGLWYTKDEFADFFGGLEEWRVAERHPAARASSKLATAGAESRCVAGHGCRKRRGPCDGRAARQCQGRAMVAAMLALIAFEEHAYLSLAVPWLGSSPSARGFLTALGVTTGLSVLYFYALTSFTDPGRPEPSPAASPGVGWCSECQAPKPARCHHCSSCGRCVLKMDHHCIFVNNCVGQNNQRHFLKFLLSLLAGLCCPVLGLLPRLPEAALGASPDGGLVPHTDRLQVVLAFLAGAVALCLIINILLFHIHLVLRNETTLESLDNFLQRRRGGYDVGPLANLALVFGEPPGWMPRGPLELAASALAQILDDGSAD